MQANTDGLHSCGAGVLPDLEALTPGLVRFDLIGLGAGEITDTEIGRLEASAACARRGGQRCWRLKRCRLIGELTPRGGCCDRAG